MGVCYFVRKNYFNEGVLVSSTLVYYDEDPRACLKYIHEQNEPHLYKMDPKFICELD
ncbi:MAG: hypothetical protein ACRC0G_07920 [Fusobacteriaceae bacterium]